ncbi:hypothetical protein [Cryobacterium sp. CG_9.6]|uniref:hypothetical protein n=1 Tax=Cryobacterium sp. CG_9.6 TaxID=2760710 RepID=UPI0024751D26|nr:hypothetical protein [Cryobacterium sp. CG_9.6]MDH6238570.1 hypothetical protein [Cryobacterium sp. CG_9.6]
MRAVVLVAALFVAVAGLTLVSSNSASAQDFSQCDSVDNTPGLELICDVSVENNLNLTSGVESSTVATTVCEGANGASKCGPASTESYNTLTSAVSQCNYALNGGGGNLDCTVTVVNNITGAADEDKAPTGATVNQCVGSATGGGTALICDPFPAATSSATITQCNDSAIGGGGATGVICTVHPSTQSALLPVTITQCNNSANGGGASVTCDATLTNNSLNGEAAPKPSTLIAPLKNTLHDSLNGEAKPKASTLVAPLKNTLHDSLTDGFGLPGATGVHGTFFLGVGV